jgi:hypothetical protein
VFTARYVLHCTFCPHSVFMCFVWIWEQTAIISLYNIDWLVFITETQCVYCAVRTRSVYVICVNGLAVWLMPGRHTPFNCRWGCSWNLWLSFLFGFPFALTINWLLHLTTLNAGLRNLNAECLLRGSNPVYTRWISYEVYTGTGFYPRLSVFTYQYHSINVAYWATPDWHLRTAVFTCHSTQRTDICCYQDRMNWARVRPFDMWRRVTWQMTASVSRYLALASSRRLSGAEKDSRDAVQGYESWPVPWGRPCFGQLFLLGSIIAPFLRLCLRYLYLPPWRCRHQDPRNIAIYSSAPVSTVIRSKTYRCYVKQQIIPNAIYNVIFV